MNLESTEAIYPGKLITLVYEDHEIEAIVIDPNGLGEGKPTIGMGFNMTERHVGIPHNTLSSWSLANNADQSQSLTEQRFDTSQEVILTSPSKTKYKLHPIVDENNREQLVIEAGDWVELAGDILETPGKVKRPTQVKVIRFLKWFAAKGFYSSCYTQLFGAYTTNDDNALTGRLLQVQQENEILRSENEQLSGELALTEYQLERIRYALDSVSDELDWRNGGCIDDRDLLEEDEREDEEEVFSPYLH